MATANDNFANAVAVSIAATGGTYTGPTQTHTGNTMETGEPQPTGFSSSRSAWWTYTPVTSGNAQIDTMLSTLGLDTEIAIYTGSAIGSLTKIASNSDSGGSGASLISSVALTAGVTYYIQCNIWVSSDDVGRNLVLRVIGPAAGGRFYFEPPGMTPKDWSIDHPPPVYPLPWTWAEWPNIVGEGFDWATITTGQMSAYRTEILAGASGSPRRVVAKLANDWTVTWSASTVVGVGTVVRPTTGNGLLYLAVTGGTTGSTEPTWPSQLQNGGAKVTDGTVTWVSAGRGAMCTSSSAAEAADSWVLLFYADPSRSDTWPTATLSAFAALLAPTPGTVACCRLVAV